jgi:hypothetical protein
MKRPKPPAQQQPVDESATVDNLLDRSVYLGVYGHADVSSPRLDQLR